jgi:hypothetical protein
MDQDVDKGYNNSWVFSKMFFEIDLKKMAMLFFQIHVIFNQI